MYPAACRYAYWRRDARHDASGSAPTCRPPPPTAHQLRRVKVDCWKRLQRKCCPSLGMHCARRASGAFLRPSSGCLPASAADPENTARDDLLLGSRVVLNMLDCIEKPENHCVYFDNFFTSRDLLIHLRNLGFRATGTVRENRVGDCPLLSSNELKKTVRGNYDNQFDRNGEVLVVRWHDNRCVTIGTNFDKVEPLGAATQYSRQANKKTQEQHPAVLKSYNAYMGGVDHHDWLVVKYATVIRGKKLYWILFTRMLEMALINAWLFNRLAHGKNAQDLLDFRRTVTVAYLKLDTGRPNIGHLMEYPSSQLRVIPDIRFDGIGHITKEARKEDV
ncbi:piggyBac transposable element-derived protein 3-like [Schistocerca nitens]|uniref:piggyBac transposable element-derived protein 3-like n=1 Tax=Schistocerca nitens TaxID=7011 RepID=UPI00211889A9|nr:piggyBac transposable element-derived protein 3-like [Schistocerca nitens]